MTSELKVMCKALRLAHIHEVYSNIANENSD